MQTFFIIQNKKNKKFYFGCDEMTFAVLYTEKKVDAYLYPDKGGAETALTFLKVLGEHQILEIRLHQSRF